MYISKLKCVRGMEFCLLFVGGTHDLCMCYCKALLYLFRHLAHILRFVEL
jgi:hypothetical protein